MSTYTLLAISLAVPPLWAMVLRWVLRRQERKKRRFRPEGEPPSDYSI